jgi:hypothetical protein
VTYNPLIDKEKCQIGNPATWVVKVGCGKVELQPLPPAITDPGGPFKDMMVDAINYCLNGSTQVAGATGNSIPIPMIGSMMADAINKAIAENCPFKDGGAAGAAAAASPVGAAPTVSAQPPARPASAPTASSAYTLTPIPNATGRLGRLALKIPKEASETRYSVCPAGGSEAKPSKSGFGALATTLLPGRYDVYVSKKLIANVPVESGKETALSLGEFKTTNDKNTKVIVFDADGKTELFAAYGPHEIALPAGDYVLDISGTTTPLSIKANEIAEY